MLCLTPSTAALITQHHPNTGWGQHHTTRHPTAKVSPAARSAWLSWPSGSSPRKASHQNLQSFKHKLIHKDKIEVRILNRCKRSVRPMLTTAAWLAMSRRVLSPNRMYNRHRSWQTFCSNTCRPKYPQNPINRLSETRNQIRSCHSWTRNCLRKVEMSLPALKAASSLAITPYYWHLLWGLWKGHVLE